MNRINNFGTTMKISFKRVISLQIWNYQKKRIINNDFFHNYILYENKGKSKMF